MRRFIFPLSLVISGMLLFAGCSGDTAEVTTAPDVVENTVSTPEVTTPEPVVEIVEEEKEPIVIEPDNSYMYEDLCKVKEEYDETIGVRRLI